MPTENKGILKMMIFLFTPSSQYKRKETFRVLRRLQNIRALGSCLMYKVQLKFITAKESVYRLTRTCEMSLMKIMFLMSIYC